MKRYWHDIVRWFETGDLVPLLIIVSAVHYAVVLAGKDQWIVAIAIGLLVDLGHYRWVKAAARYDGGKTGQIITRWTFALVMTGISFAYHLRYYGGDLWLSVPIPLLIASLAWLSKVDRRTDTHPARIEAQIAPQPERIPEYLCAQCGEGFASSAKLAAHVRWKHKVIEASE